jgi:YfiH family protein
MIIQAEILAARERLRHAFFTREGGVSEGPFASLNCGFSSGDEASLVAENSARAVHRLGLSPDRLCTARQVHGTTVLVAREPSLGRPSLEADALVTDRTDLALGVLSADCAPVLLADPDAGVIGAAHAGWRGALAGIVEATIDAMAGLGAERTRIVAAIGPCIAQPSYEVGPEVLDKFTAADAESTTHFLRVPGSDRLLFDLKAHVRRRLLQAGVASCLALPQDTAADERHFFSHRRTRRSGGERFGLLLSAIALTS